MLTQVITKRLSRWQEYTSVAHRIALNKVEIAVGVQLVVIIQSVATQHLQQRGTLYALVGYVGQIYTGGVALILNVQAELGFLHSRGQVVHVLHHQLPVGLLRIVRCILNSLHVERLRCLGDVGSKLAHLIGHATRCKLEGHSQHLVGLQSRLQRDISQSLIYCVLRRCEQSGTRQLLVVASVLEVGDSR